MKKTILSVLMFLFIILFNIKIVSAKTVDVKSFKEFEQAMLDKAVATINVTENIKFEKSINYLPNRDLTINGNSDKLVTINTNDFSIIINNPSNLNSTFTLQNTEIYSYDLSSNSTGGISIKDESSNIKYYLNNVRFYGYKFIYAPNSTIMLDGSNKLTTDDPGIEAKNLIFKANSDFVGSSPISSDLLQNIDTITIEENANVYSYDTLEVNNLYLKQGSKLTILSNYNGGLTIMGNAVVEKDATLDIQPGGTALTAESEPKIQPSWWIEENSPLIIYNGSLNINPEAKFYIKNDRYRNAIIAVNSNITFDNPQNLEINNNYNNQVFGLDDVSKINIKLPNRVDLISYSESNSETPYTLSNINGYIKNNLSTTNNNNFDSIYSSYKIKKISYDSSKVISYKVTFDSKGGSPNPKEQIVTSGEKLVKPTTPTKNGFVFDGWQYNSRGWFPVKGEWNFNDPVYSDLELYAKWIEQSTKDSFTVTFDSRGGTAVKPIYNVKSGSTIKMPAVPKKANNVFGGWYADKDFTVRWIFSKSKVYDNITLYGWWSRDN